MSRRNSLQLPSGIADREDRMLAYYINLIQQQEQQEKTRTERSGSFSNDGDVVDASKKEQNVISTEPKVEEPITQPSVVLPVKRQVGRPRKHPLPEMSGDQADSESVKKSEPVASSNKVTPKKSTKQLELDEAERIISTIMERRPGRAEFKVPERAPAPPTVVEQTTESVVSAQVKDNSTPKKVSAKLLAQEEAERIIATIERRPTATSARALEEPKSVVVVPEVVEKKPVEVKQIEEEPVVVKKRGPGRPPKKVQPQAPTSNEQVLVVVVPAAQSPPVEQKPSKQVTPRKRPQSPLKDVSKPEKIAKISPAPAARVEETPTVPGSFRFHQHPSSKEANWWNVRKGLTTVPFEEELDNVLCQIRTKASETREELVLHARSTNEGSVGPFLTRMILNVE